MAAAESSSSSEVYSRDDNIDYANYCSLPRRSKESSSSSSRLPVFHHHHHYYHLSPVMTHPVNNHHHNGNGQPPPATTNPFENPGVYLRSVKKCSVDSKLRNCVVDSGGRQNFGTSKAGPAVQPQIGYRHQQQQQHHQHNLVHKRAQAVYEMSSDLHQKQLDIWCKKYGGYRRAERAAVTIQKAFRKYALEKNFEQVLEKRRSGVSLINNNKGKLPVRQENFHGAAAFVSNIIIEDDVVVGGGGGGSVGRATISTARQTQSLQNVFQPSTFRRKGHSIGGTSKIFVANNSHVCCDMTSLDGHDSSPEDSNHRMCTAESSVDRKLQDQELIDTRYVSYVRISSDNCVTPCLFTATTNNNNSNKYNVSVDTGDKMVSEHCNQDLLLHRSLVDQLKSVAVISDNHQQRPVAPGGSLYDQRRQNSCQTGIVSVVNGYGGDLERTTNGFKITNCANNVNDDARLTAAVDMDLGNIEDNVVAAYTSPPKSPRKDSLSRMLVGALSPRYTRRKQPAVSVAELTVAVDQDSKLDAYHGEMCHDYAGRDVQSVQVLPQCSAETSTSNKVAEPDNNYSTSKSHYYRLPSTAKREELIRRRQYRIGLNFFNKKPERGIEFLICWGFIDGSPFSVAKFLSARKGLSKQMIGEYLGNLQSSFNQQVLRCFVQEIDMTNLEIDVALRKFQAKFRLPGEAQKIERIVEVFANRYCQCNPDLVSKFKQADTVFILAFAIIMLNTDLHSPNVKPNKRMKVEDFVKNLRGIDGGCDVDAKLLTNIYHRVKQAQFKSDADHVTQVLRVESCLVGKKPTLALPHRRLVCFCRLAEIVDPSKKQSTSVHQREIFLFNDTLMVTKILSRRKSNITYTYRESHCLVGAQVTTFRNQNFNCGIEINFTLENKKVYFNARCEDDRRKFVEDLREAIHETDEMEALRIELELQRQSGGTSSCALRQFLRGQYNRDCREMTESPENAMPGQGRRNSDRVSTLYDDQIVIHRHSSATSLDSGMSSASLGSRESFQHLQNNQLAKINENGVADNVEHAS